MIKDANGKFDYLKLDKFYCIAAMKLVENDLL